MSVVLQDKVRDLDRLIESKRSAAKESWSKFERLRDELAKADVDVTDDNSEAFAKAHEAHEEYGRIADEVEELQEKRQKLWAMVGENDREFGSEAQKLAERVVKDGLHSRESWGAKAIASERYAQLRDAGVFTSAGSLGNVTFGSVASADEFYALVVSDPDGTNTVAPFIEPDHRGFVEPRFRPLLIMDLITVLQTSSDSVDYVIESGWTNNAAGVPEAETDEPIGGGVTTAKAGLKPQSVLSYVKKDAPVKTIAHWMALTRKSLSDVPRLRTIVDTRLRRGLLDKLEDDIIAGDGQGENLLGILNTPGIQHQSRGSGPLVDDVLRAMTKVRLAYFEPTAVGMDPNDWESIRLMRDDSGSGSGTGGYLFGAPSIAGPTTLWGVPTVQGPQFVEGQPIVGDFRVVEYYVREGVQVSASDSHADFFTRNLVALLAETRGALAIPQPEGLCEISEGGSGSGGSGSGGSGSA